MVFAAGRIVYNVYFHRLSSFPGPKSHAATFLPFVFGIYGGKNHLKTARIHEQYGDTVRIAPDVLSFTGSQAWKDIYGSRPGKGQLPKDRKFYIGNQNKVPDILNSFDDGDHARIRKLLSHAFSEQALREEEKIVEKYVDLLIQKLRDRVHGPEDGKVDITKYFNYVAFDIIGDLALGESFGALQNEVYHFWIAFIIKSINFGRYLIIGTTYPIIGVLMMPLMLVFPSKLKQIRKYMRYPRELVEKRTATKTDRNDFMTYILRHNDERGMSQLEIKNTITVLLLAGESHSEKNRPYLN